ncbi:hypothetical protein QAD02_022800 [Eretmocerus hayati]|uniref:Uncharacterized protein n=1 Tax=Eretmocerus hayati TaxID=131215 RepID=A0ACC2PU06_9HYME|nr:hypothetical protein QAD02_022800 [Eretmocerus hayati]
MTRGQLPLATKEKNKKSGMELSPNARQHSLGHHRRHDSGVLRYKGQCAKAERKETLAHPHGRCAGYSCVGYPLPPEPPPPASMAESPLTPSAPSAVLTLPPVAVMLAPPCTQREIAALAPPAPRSFEIKVTSSAEGFSDVDDEELGDENF